MSTKRIIILGGGFGGVKCAETLRDELPLSVAFGRSCRIATTKLLQSLATPFDPRLRQWQRPVIDSAPDFSAHTDDGSGMYRLSRCVLLAREDKTFQDERVASMSIPWGETNGDNDLGGDHLVRTRDMVQSAMALLASGQTRTPVRALIWLAAIQPEDGGFPHNSCINGGGYWGGQQLGEVATPIWLVWRLRRADALGNYHVEIERRWAQ